MPNLSSLNKIENDSLLLIDKPKAMSSFGVVARLRRLLNQELGKKAKVGHTGTLDPFASGLLILLTGKRCREADQFLKLDKAYQVELVLGATTASFDPETRLYFGGRQQPSRRQIEASLQTLTGEIQQKPPLFSAIKIAGRRAYHLARNGEEVELPARAVTIYKIEILDYNYPSLSLNLEVSSGTYVRSFVRDLGEKLGTTAYCRNLRRTRVGKYSVEQAHKLSDFGLEN